MVVRLSDKLLLVAKTHTFPLLPKKRQALFQLRFMRPPILLYADNNQLLFYRFPFLFNCHTLPFSCHYAQYL